MAESQTLLTVDLKEDDVRVVKLLPRRILDELQISEIGQGISALVDTGANKLVLDFSNVDHLSSSALGMLITVKRQLDSAKGQLKLCYIRSQILQIFQITRLDALFDIYASDVEALASFNQ
jgi:anti-sigma B factor antagonist